jgi:hypothetical protein
VKTERFQPAKAGKVAQKRRKGGLVERRAAKRMGTGLDT